MTKKIMLIDDSEDIHYTIKTGINAYCKDEYEIISAEGGEQCFQILNEGTVPDIILLDLMMPQMDGWEVFDRLKAKNSQFNDIPIIFLTAKKDKDSLDVGRQFGEGYIEKPFLLKELIDQIEHVLEKKNQ